MGVTAGGHALAGGGPVGLGVLGVGAVGVAAFAYGVSGRELGPAGVIGGTVGVQLGLHELFGWVAPAPVLVTGHFHLNLGMGIVHLVVGVVTGWWLYRGESALGLMVRLWGAPLVRVFRWTVGVAPVRVSVPLWTVFADPVVRRTQNFARVVAWRGPPGMGCA
ncbi:hypothetical protein [Acrocarpospora catenulata]|uniref:hypothetical protein n=1 Tax=Acrocarpospora catenulata TaxID=2836182 RepID=UPI001BDA41E9|nr:hypothetical protein [Acrocarpospora catenulata]